jgi:SsrA-binding protein
MLKNRRASFDYELLERFEAGLVLTGSEVKSLREGGGSLAEAFARVKGGEVWLEGMHIRPYQNASYNNHDPLRSRKLLLSRREIAEVRKGLERKGLTLVPLKLYFKDGWAKVELALARGKKRHDKRQAEAKRDAQREIERALKR